MQVLLGMLGMYVLLRISEFLPRFYYSNLLLFCVCNQRTLPQVPRLYAGQEVRQNSGLRI